MKASTLILLVLLLAVIGLFFSSCLEQSTAGQYFGSMRQLLADLFGYAAMFVIIVFLLLLTVAAFRRPKS